MLYTDIRPIPGDFVTKIAPLAELANRRPRLYREMTLSPVFLLASSIITVVQISSGIAAPNGYL
jgi:hypothetical protein